MSTFAEHLSSGNAFADKVALITGAASGLRRATALAFARNGATLALLDINQSGLEQTTAAYAEFGACISIDSDISAG